MHDNAERIVHMRMYMHALAVVSALLKTTRRLHSRYRFTHVMCAYAHERVDVCRIWLRSCVRGSEPCFTNICSGVGSSPN